MTKGQLLNIIDTFQSGTDRKQTIDELIPELLLSELLAQQKISPQQIVSDAGYRAFRRGSVYLLWDEELMYLALFRQLKDIGKQLRRSRPGDHLPLFPPFPIYIDAATFDLEMDMAENADRLRDILAFNLDIQPKALDYSQESLLVLDEKIESAVIQQSFIDRNLIPLGAYLGTVYLRHFSGTWELGLDPGSDKPLPFIKNEHERWVNLLRVVYQGLTGMHGDTILPSLLLHLISRRSGFDP